MDVLLPDFSKSKVLIVGDVMLDRYWHGPVSRVSPEAPVPVVKVNKIEERPGGAGNVALNIAALGGHVTLLSLVGEDEPAHKLSGVLESAGVTCVFHALASHPTITKLRVLSQHQQLLRMDFEEKFDALDSKNLLLHFSDCVSKFDAVILSDYGKGTLLNARAFIELAKQADVPVFVDPKSNDFGVYQGATVITPNFHEFQAAVGPCETEAMLVDKAHELLKAHDLEALLITRGEQGMTLVSPAMPERHLPTRAKEVFDVTGAGDTVIAVFALSVASGLDFVSAMKVANAAAGIVVGKLGSATVSVPELAHVIHDVPDGGVMNEMQLKLAIERVHARGEKVVMTNGCFDVLHAGHVAYLEQAKALGNRLIVAVNDDLSVCGLKGPDRPINPLEKRLAVLLGLHSVDWVIPFSEETPERLICHLLPDVLVKGGDYAPHEIAGYECVTKNGGQVKVLDFLEGCSTTSVVEKMKKLK